MFAATRERLSISVLVIFALCGASPVWAGSLTSRDSQLEPADESRVAEPGIVSDYDDFPVDDGTTEGFAAADSSDDPFDAATYIPTEPDIRYF